MSNTEELSPVRKMLGDFAPKFIELTEDVLLGDVWKRKELSPRDRSLISISSLITGGDTEPLKLYLNNAIENGLSEEELIEVMTHLAFYTGWSKAISAIKVAKEVFSKEI